MSRLGSAIRPVLFWTHLVFGLVAGLLILLMSVTGVLLGFERQTIAWIDGAPRVAPSEGAPLPLDTTLARLGVARADVASIVMRHDPREPLTIRLRERGAAPLLVDPFRAERLQATGTGKGQALFSALRRWHRWVGAQGAELRARMKVVAGTANLIFLGLVVSGIYLWWPRRWTRARLLATTRPQWHRSGRVRDFNWHNSLGFWGALPLALIIASGAFVSFRWPGQWLDVALGSTEERRVALEQLRGATSPVPTAATPTPAAPPSSAAVAASRPTDAALAVWVASAAAAHPAWRQLTLTLPDEGGRTMRVAVAEGNTYRPDLRWTLTLDRTSGAVAQASGYADLSASRRIRAWVRFGHTGEVFGMPGQFLATLATAIGAVLVWTGFALAFRRMQQWATRRRRSVPAMAAAPDAPLQAPAPLR